MTVWMDALDLLIYYLKWNENLLIFPFEIVEKFVCGRALRDAQWVANAPGARW